MIQARSSSNWRHCLKALMQGKKHRLIVLAQRRPTLNAPAQPDQGRYSSLNHSGPGDGQALSG
jgi:hypothetical protein